MEDEIKDVMVKSGGGHELIPAKRLSVKHPLFQKLFPYRWNPGRHGGKKSITVVRSVFNWLMAGRKINKGEHIYHIDGNKHNDDIENLVALTVTEQCRLMGFMNKYKGVPLPKGLVETYIELLRLNTKREQNDT